jgi:hypothetical protein
MINNNNYTLQDIMNKLFCTFTSHEDLEETLNTIKSHYSILYGKIFILEAKDSDELLCTYNIDPINSNSKVISNTILLHRKKTKPWEPYCNIMNSTLAHRTLKISPLSSL